MARSRQDVIAACQRYGKALENVFGTFDLRLFGSYHRGDANEHSDIDVAVVCDDFAGIDDIIGLQILSRLKVNVDSYIEPISMTFTDLAAPLRGSIESFVAKDSTLVYRCRPPYLNMQDSDDGPLAPSDA